MKNLKEAIEYRHNYLESAGRHDKSHVVDAVAERGADTVLRLCLWRNGQDATTGTELRVKRPERKR